MALFSVGSRHIIYTGYQMGNKIIVWPIGLLDVSEAKNSHVEILFNYDLMILSYVGCFHIIGDNYNMEWIGEISNSLF